MVDESILALTNYQLTDPIAVFYTDRPSDVWSTYSRASIILANPLAFTGSQDQVMATQTANFALGGGDGERIAVAEEMEMPAAAEPAAPMAEMAKSDANIGPAQPAITVRSDFNPLATFAPDVRTDAQGEATVKVKLPDNLTRYRIMVVAVDSGGSKFGSA